MFLLGIISLNLPIVLNLSQGTMLKLPIMDIKVVSTNKKARFEFFILETYEAGLVLKGTEIKSVRSGQISLQEAYVRTNGKEIWLVGAHIAPYENASAFQHDPKRDRKLLMHKKEIRKLFDEIRIKGMTLVPMRVYLKAGRAKLEIGLAKGKKQYDKRDAIKERDVERETSRNKGDW